MFRKFKADRIFTGSELLDAGHVLVTRADGTVESVIREEEAGDGVECFDGWLSPGFVNAHCHLDLSHLKGQLREGEGLLPFIRQVMNLRDGKEQEKKNEAMLRALDEMHREGIVAVGDICTGTASLEIKKFSSLEWVNFIELTGMSDKDAEGRFGKSLQIRSLFDSLLPESVSAFSPHAPYSVSPSLMKLVNDHSADEVITIHNQESPEENKLYGDKTGAFISLYEQMGIDVSAFKPTGMSSLMSWTKHFNKKQRIIAVHNTYADANDIEYAKMAEQEAGGPQLYFCLCPGANLFIEQNLPAVNVLIQSGARIVLGTDSLASNHRLSILNEMKLIHHHFRIRPEAMLCWATLQGAEALGLEDRLGIFEKGKKPGINQITEPASFEKAAVKKIL